MLQSELKFFLFFSNLDDFTMLIDNKSKIKIINYDSDNFAIISFQILILVIVY